MSTKVTSLTPSNVDALRQAIAETNYLSTADVTVTATTAIFRDDAQMAWARVRDAIVILGQRYGGNQHPAKSLHAVRRKLEKIVADEVRTALPESAPAPTPATESAPAPAPADWFKKDVEALAAAQIKHTAADRVAKARKVFAGSPFYGAQ